VWVGVGDEAERERKKERNDTIIKKKGGKRHSGRVGEEPSSV